MFDDVFNHRLLQQMRQEGAIGLRTLPRVRSLLSHGLSLEQTLIGAGLMRPEAYGSFLSQAFGVPFVRVSSCTDPHQAPFSPTVQRALEAVLISCHENRCVVAMTQPDTERLGLLRQCAEEGGWIVEPRVMLRSDWLALGTTSFGKHATPVFSHKAFHKIRVLPTRRGAEVLGDDSLLMTLPVEQSSAFASALARRLERDDWAMQKKRTLFGTSLAASRVHARTDAHPLSLSDRLREYLERPDGLLVLIRPDQALREQVGSFADIVAARTPTDQENVLHQTLAGERVIAQSDGDDTWWNAAVAAGIPVFVVRSDLMPEGLAWRMNRC